MEKVTTTTDTKVDECVENTVTSNEIIESDKELVTDESGKPAKGKET